MSYLSFIQWIVVLLAGWLPAGEAESYKTTRQVGVVIEKGSQLSINGSTNVNTFSCGYEGKIGQDTINIQFTQTKNGTLLLDHASLTVEVKRFDCGNQVMNRDFRKLLEYEQHPQLQLHILSLRFPHKEIQQGDAVARVEFIIAGQKEIYDVPVSIAQNADPDTYYGKKAMDITDFDLRPPSKFLGMVMVDKEVEVDFRLSLRLL